MINTRAAMMGAKEPVEEGLRQLLELTPVEISSGHYVRTLNEVEEVMSDCQILLADGGIVPGSLGRSFPMHNCVVLGEANRSPVYMGVHPNLRGRCVVLCRKSADADDILKLLKRCDHPNILKPSGVWELGDKVFITFPPIDGTLSQINAEELLIMDRAGHKDGFTKEGQKIFRDLIHATHHINKMAYSNISGSRSSEGGSDTPPPVLALQLGADRIFYKKIEGSGGYHVLIGDFYAGTNDIQRLPKTLNNNLQKIRKYNWRCLGEYLGSLIGSKANAELNHLRDILMSPTVTFDDIMWEPALWDCATKMHFIREVYFSIELDTNNHRSTELSKKPELGMHEVIATLGGHIY